MKTVKVLSLLFVSLMLVQLYAMAPVASATPHHDSIQVSGDIKIHPGKILWSHTSGDITYIIAKQSATFFGSFKGLGVIYWYITENSETGVITTVGVGTFTGNMDKKTGTFTFTTVGQGLWWTFQNDWVITGGTKGFSKIHGDGTLEGNLVTLTGSYSGSVYFSP